MSRRDLLAGAAFALALLCMVVAASVALAIFAHLTVYIYARLW